MASEQQRRELQRQLEAARGQAEQRAAANAQLVEHLQQVGSIWPIAGLVGTRLLAVADGQAGGWLWLMGRQVGGCMASVGEHGTFPCCGSLAGWVNMAHLPTVAFSPGPRPAPHMLTTARSAGY